MNKEHLSSTNPPHCWLTVLPPAEFAHMVGSLAKGSGRYVAIIDGHLCRTLDELFHEFARAFRFPEYFGRNWPAFDECLNDLDWLSAESYILVVKDADKLLVDEPHEIHTISRALLRTAIEWNVGRQYDSFPTNPTPFKVVLHLSPGCEDSQVSVAMWWDVLADLLNRGASI